MQTDLCTDAPSGGLVARGDYQEVKRRLALVSSAAFVSSWAFAGAVAAADGTGGATAMASAGAVAALLLRWGC